MRTINLRRRLFAALVMVPLATHAQQMYQLHNDGWMFRYTGTPCSGESCPGWERLANNARTLSGRKPAPWPVWRSVR